MPSPPGLQLSKWRMWCTGPPWPSVGALQSVPRHLQSGHCPPAGSANPYTCSNNTIWCSLTVGCCIGADGDTASYSIVKHRSWVFAVGRPHQRGQCECAQEIYRDVYSFDSDHFCMSKSKAISMHGRPKGDDTSEAAFLHAPQSQADLH